MNTSRPLLGICTLLCLVLALGAVTEAKKAVQTPHSIIRRLLLEEPNSWKWQLVEAFVQKLPERVAIPLAYQSAESIGKFVVSRRNPTRVKNLGRVTVCMASTGEGGSYLAIISHRTREYPVVFDTLMPPSLLRGQIDFVDLDNDSVPEVICHGIGLHSNKREWAIISWNLSGGNLLAPRLDHPSKSLLHNRLIGKQLNILADRDDGALRLELITGDPPEDWVTIHPGQSHRRTFRFHDDIGGYLPDE